MQGQSSRLGARRIKPSSADDISATHSGQPAGCNPFHDSALHIDYQGTRIKQYHKEGRALRTETTINNTYDFYIGKNLRNLPALRRIGFHANRRLLQVQCISHDCILAEETFQKLNRPLQVASQRTSAFRFADPQIQDLWRTLLLFQLLPNGFSNRDLRQHFAALLGRQPESLSPGQMSYHLRRL